ncbi:MAG: type II toxin-antitoxin system VapC family toxin [Terrimicrobiaceae bacterium]|nr:type II toxin-antitoxin system VapC family toxin [Terrimicrobiaceae bacterium]
MAPYFDTALLIKIYVKETTSPEAIALILGTSAPLPLTHIQELEMRNALRLKHSRGEMTAVQLKSALRIFQTDIAAGRFQRPAYDLAAVFHRAEELSRKYTSQTKSRSLDVLHVAAAVEIGSRDFASFDERQRAVARKAGLTVLPARIPKS